MLVSTATSNELITGMQEEDCSDLFGTNGKTVTLTKGVKKRGKSAYNLFQFLIVRAKLVDPGLHKILNSRRFRHGLVRLR